MAGHFFLPVCSYGFFFFFPDFFRFFQNKKNESATTHTRTQSGKEPELFALDKNKLSRTQRKEEEIIYALWGEPYKPTHADKMKLLHITKLSNPHVFFFCGGSPPNPKATKNKKIKKAN